MFFASNEGRVQIPTHALPFFTPPLFFKATEHTCEFAKQRTKEAAHKRANTEGKSSKDKQREQPQWAAQPRLSALLISTWREWFDQLIIWFIFKSGKGDKSWLYFWQQEPQSRKQRSTSVYGERCKEAWIFNLHLYWQFAGILKIGSVGSKTHFLMRTSGGRM